MSYDDLEQIIANLLDESGGDQQPQNRVKRSYNGKPPPSLHLVVIFKKKGAEVWQRR
ncbi:hypothetical protein [Desulfosarcina sp.]|uniref:hypothetical protein n=1 Tax=Desulfosarcina sp. TaxID=2027861 RepID=UPI0029B14A3B|nr:hypothetical protein [Desulfosarcina sp.]MDX2452685.1 hypothetical protein [Desulfosarcina sp.]